MPELPEVETVCRGLRPLVGARITAAAAHRADLRAPLPRNLGKRLTGRAITGITRRAKYILVALDGGETLLLHLGMSGRMTLSHDNAPLQKHDHISLATDNGFFVRFNDPRRFGYCDLVATDKLSNHKLLRGLGIEPLSKDFTPDALAAILKNRNTSIKAALLDQKHVVGIGNIYACEALFRAGINPSRPAHKITRAEIAALAAAIRDVLRAAIKAGGSTLRDYVQADGELGYFQHNFAVYGRAGLPCPGCTCDVTKTGGIKRIAQNGRSSFYCATKQK
ncbi:MAG: bifunctional DNA-formamidopyrimidine glycosylase/DNA-(apurinic or apyrimidinic site) lyase [Alphaproteobacteria bacterium]|nr:bifunctional DNA-formamidopyrimidine glycosylase/DNA-(apurinic or apyrimidinic site) lyase [Alphaproteobacteria bacterium]